MMPSSLNFRAVVPMVDLMNAIAQVSAAPVSGPKLDNRRVAAAIIDLLIVSVGAVAILVAGDSLSGDRQSALGAVILGWALYYFFATESGEGQTLGKKAMKLRVVRADGRPASMGEIAVRTVLRVIDNYLVGMIVMLATGERRWPSRRRRPSSRTSRTRRTGRTSRTSRRLPRKPSRTSRSRPTRSRCPPARRRPRRWRT